jgi:aminoglycoside/choline kinase family phosphotransferase
MSELRKRQIETFLARVGWGEARRTMLAGDASDRHYERLIAGPDGRRAVLMDAPSQAGEEIRLSATITRFLLENGLSAPEIIALDDDKGLALIEDFGDALFARVLETEPESEANLYAAATDVLLRLHDASLPSLPDYGAKAMVDGIALAFEWYGLGADGHYDPVALAETQKAFTRAFEALAPWQPVVVLRDYHAENLFWLPDREGEARVGLIDYQDAVIGHPAYDLVSLARDVRRDVSPHTVELMFDRYCSKTGEDPDAFRHSAALVSAQRNLRILGIFARLSMHFGKPKYVDLIPRTWANLMVDLAHPALTDLSTQVAASLPEPKLGVLSSLKEQCGSCPDL